MVGPTQCLYLSLMWVSPFFCCGSFVMTAAGGASAVYADVPSGAGQGTL